VFRNVQFRNSAIIRALSIIVVARENKPERDKSLDMHNMFFSCSTISFSLSRRERMIAGNDKISLSLSLSLLNVCASHWRLSTREAPVFPNRASRRRAEREKERQRE